MPNYDVQAPDGKVYTVQAPEGATEQQIFRFVQQQLNQPAPRPKEPAGFLDSLGSGIDYTQTAYGSALEGLGGKLGAEGLEQYGADIVARNEAERAKQKQRTTFKDVQAAEGILDTASALGSFGKGALGESLPQMGINIAGSIAGAKAGAKAGRIAGLPGAVVGGIAGGLAGAIPFFYGDNREAQKESIEQGLISEIDEGAAFLGAIPQASLDIVADRFLFGLTKRGLDLNLDDVLQKGGVFTRGAKNVAAGATIEIPTEIGQEIISRYQAGQAIDSPEAIEAYIEVGAAAGLVGGTIRGASGVVRGDKEAQKAKDDKIIEEVEAQRGAEDETVTDDDAGIDTELDLSREDVNLEQDRVAAQLRADELADLELAQEQLRRTGDVDDVVADRQKLDAAKREMKEEAAVADPFYDPYEREPITDEEAAEYIRTGKNPFIKETYDDSMLYSSEETTQDTFEDSSEFKELTERLRRDKETQKTPTPTPTRTPKALATPETELEILKNITTPDVTVEEFQARAKELDNDYVAIEQLGTKENALLHLAGDINTSTKIPKDTRTKEEKAEDKAKTRPKSQNVMMQKTDDIAETTNKLKNLGRVLKPTETVVKDKKGNVTKDEKGNPVIKTSYPMFGSKMSPTYKYSGGKNAYDYYNDLSNNEKTFVVNEITRLKTLEMRAERIKASEDKGKGEETPTILPESEEITLAEEDLAREDAEAAIKTDDTTLTEEAISGFTTAKGSTYVRYSDNTTIRNRAKRGDKEGSGIQPRSGKTVYMTKANADEIGGLFQKGERGTYQLVPNVKNNTAKLIFTKNYGPKKAGANATKSVPFLTEPKVGLIPIEILNSVNTNPRNIHFGNKITDITFNKQRTRRKTEDDVYVPVDDAGYPLDAAGLASKKIQDIREAKKLDPNNYEPSPEEKKELEKYRLETIPQIIAVDPSLKNNVETINQLLTNKLISMREESQRIMLEGVDDAANNDNLSVTLPLDGEITTIEQARDAIGQRFNNANISDVITIVRNPEEAGLTGINNDVGGVVRDNKAYLFTDRIQEGTEFSVFMHEVGVHKGMKNLLNPVNYNYILSKINKFLKDKSNSRGAQIARAAKERLDKVTPFDPMRTQEKINDELIAYFVEEAVRRGVDPLTISKVPSEFGSIFKKLVDSIKRFLSKLGFTFDPKTSPIDEQDIVDIAFGAAAFELRSADSRYNGKKLESLFDDPSQSKILVDTLSNLNALTDNKVGYSEFERYTLGQASGIKNSFRRLMYRTLSFYQLADEVRRIGKEGTELSRKSEELANNIRELEYIVAKRRRMTDDNRRAFTDALIIATQYRDEALEGLNKQQQKELLKEFGNIAHESSIERIDLRDYFKDPKDRDPNVVLSDLYERFLNLPAPLRKSYAVMANQYQAAGQALIDAEKLLMGDNPTQQQLEKLNMLRQQIVPYFPLVRDGAYWVDVMLPVDEKSTERTRFTFTYESESEANRAQKDFEKDGFEIDRAVYKRGVNDDLQDGTYNAYSTLLNKLATRETTSLQEKETNRKIINVLKESMMDFLPAEALRQQYKTRKNIPGYNNDVFKNFANMGFKLSNELTQIQSLKELNDKIDAITVADNKIDARLADAVAVVSMKASYLRTPVPKRYAAYAAYAGYNAFLMGNVSSALVNLTQLPIVVFPKLYDEFGLVKATKMMTSTINKYIKNVANPDKGRDDNTALKVPIFGWNLADVTIFTKEELAADPGLEEVYNRSLDRGGIRRTTSQELQDARKQDGFFRLGGDAQKIELALSWTFQNSERANREIGIYAAYKLGIEKGYSKEVAIQRAIDITEEASGTALAEIGPEILMDGWGKVVGTFKRFAFSQLYLQYKLARQALGFVFPSSYKPDTTMPIDPKTGKRMDARVMAVKQLAGINIMAWAVAGANNTPFYGIGWLSYTLGNATLEALGAIDEDEDRLPFDMYLKQKLPEFAWQGPWSYYTNMNLTNRAGLSPTNLLFRHDPKKMDELGFWYIPIQLSGPTLSYVQQVYDGIATMSDESRERPVFDGIAKTMPAVIKNPMKATRLLMDGAVNKKGVPLGVDVNEKDALLQFFGWSPSDVASRWEDIGFVYRLDKGIADEARELKDLYFWAIEHDDEQGLDEVMERIEKFNGRERVQKLRRNLDQKKLNQSFKNKTKYQNESLFGIALDPQTARTLFDEVSAGE